MLEFYLESVVVWWLIIKCAISLFGDKIKKKINETNQINQINEKNETKIKPIVLAAIPIIRLAVVIVLIYISTCKQEDFNELMKKANGN